MSDCVLNEYYLSRSWNQLRYELLERRNTVINQWGMVQTIHHPISTAFVDDLKKDDWHGAVFALLFQGFLERGLIRYG